jgi:hypothetical protein
MCVRIQNTAICHEKKSLCNTKNQSSAVLCYQYALLGLGIGYIRVHILAPMKDINKERSWAKRKKSCSHKRAAYA